MYSDVFCTVYNEFGWNYYPEAFGQQLIQWLKEIRFSPRTSLDLACGTGILCQILHAQGIHARGMDLSPGMIAIARANSPEIVYDVADMVTYRPEAAFDLVTCTGDAFNHIPELSALNAIFQNIHAYLSDGGWLVFDILNEHEVSSSEPFEMDFDERTRVWFQMTQPATNAVNLQIRVYADGKLQFEENIRETVHDPSLVCQMLREIGFRNISCADRLLPTQNKSTTWYITAQKNL